MLETLSLTLVLRRYQKLTRRLPTRKTRLVRALDPRRRLPRFHTQFPSDCGHCWSRMRSREGFFVLPSTIRTTYQFRPKPCLRHNRKAIRSECKTVDLRLFQSRRVRVHHIRIREGLSTRARALSMRPAPCSWMPLLQALTTQENATYQALRHVLASVSSWLLGKRDWSSS